MKPSDYIRTGWVQGATAIDAGDLPCPPEHPLATAWSMDGAIAAALAHGGVTETEASDIRYHLWIHDLQRLNDGPFIMRMGALRLMLDAERLALHGGRQ